MTDLAVTDDLFFERTGMDPGRVEAIVAEALAGMDDGELYLEYSQSESLALDDGRIKSASFDTTQGFGLRAVAGEAAGYAHASDLSEAAIRRAAATVRAVASGYSGVMAGPPPGHQPQPLYRCKPARPRRSRRQDPAPRRDRRLCAQPRPAGPPGHGLVERGVAGGADHPRRRPPGRRHPPAGAPRRRRRRRRGRPHGNRLLGRRRPARL